MGGGGVGLFFFGDGRTGWGYASIPLLLTHSCLSLMWFVDEQVQEQHTMSWAEQSSERTA